MIYACIQQPQKNWRETPSNSKILVIDKNVITETKQIWKGTSFHIQNFDCYENVLAKRGKKIARQFFICYNNLATSTKSKILIVD